MEGSCQKEYLTKILLEFLLRLSYTIQALTMFVANIFIGKVIDRIKNPLSLLIPGLCVFSLALFLLFAPYDRRGAASSTFFSSIDLGFSIGSIMGGIIIGTFSYKTFYGVAVLFSIVAIFLSLIVFRNIRLDQE
jgi:predicted MFS family arabinose efflux permease